MADSLTLPGPRVPLVDGRGLPSLAWFQFFRGLQVAQATADPVAPAFDPNAYLSSSTTVSGPFSVAVTGSLISGNAQLKLVGDLAAPGNSYYYGTNSAGAKGYHALTAGLGDVATVTVPVAAFQHSETVAAVGVTPASVVLVSLAPALDADANDPELLDCVSLWATPGTDTITFGLTFAVPTVGPIKLNWSAI
jgi:hypothetical protein